MNGKFFLYLLVTPLTIYAMDSLNINQIFKKNHVLQALIFYILMGLSIIYLVTNFLYDLFLAGKFF